MATNLSPATNLNQLNIDELWVELIWLEEQPQTKAICNAHVKCWNEIHNRQKLIDNWNEFLAG